MIYQFNENNTQNIIEQNLTITTIMTKYNQKKTILIDLKLKIHMATNLKKD